MMVAYQAELNILHHANGGTQKRDDAAETTVHRDPEPSEYHLSFDDVGESWRRGSVISSWLLDLAARALVDSPRPEMFAVRVSDSDEGRWTVIAVIDESIHAPVLTAALYERFDPHGKADFADTVLSALRFRFGGY
jgi:6-phosphogluconate dehydrogenase